MLTLTIIMKDNRMTEAGIAEINAVPALDIMVQPQQRIQSVLQVLWESGRLGRINPGERVYLRSWRRGVYLEAGQTFKQAGIWTGDILYIEVEANA